MDHTLYNNLRSLGIPRPAERLTRGQTSNPSSTFPSRRIKRQKTSHEPKTAAVPAIKSLTTVSFSLPPVLTHPATHATLQSQARLLHLLHARNKNQHRRGAWYRSFGVMRREVGRLCEDLGVQIGVSAEGASISAQAALPKKKVGEQGWVSERTIEKQKQDAERRVLVRLEYWVDAGLVVRWYEAFTRLVGDAQFAPLGLSLLAILSRICTITGCTAAFQASEREFDASPVGDEEDCADLTGDMPVHDGVDLGVVVERKTKA